MPADPKPKPKLNLTFALVFLAGFVILLGAELYGVARPQSGDTITEDWTWTSEHLPAPLGWFFVVFTLGLLAWAGFHFAKRAKNRV